MTTVLTGSAWDHDRCHGPLPATARGFADETGADLEVRWERRSLQAFADEPISGLAARHDLVILDHPHLGQAVDEGVLVALDRVLPAAELDALREGAVGRSHDSYALRGHQWAIAIDAACQVAAVRTDLVTDTPATWDEVLALGDAGGMVMPLKPVDAFCSFASIAANLGQPCATGAEGGPYVAPGHGEEVLDLLRDLAARVPASCLAMNPIEALELLAAGTRHRYSPLLFGYTNYARPGYREALVRFADIPAPAGQPPEGAILGGAGLAVSARSAHPELAARYAAWVGSGPVQRGTYVEEGGQPAHRAAWDDDEANARCSGFFRDTRRTIELSWLRPRHRGFIDFQEVAGDLVHAHLRDGGRPADVVRELNAAYAQTSGRRRSRQG